MNQSDFLREDVSQKDTWFAPAARSSGAETVTQIKLVTTDAVVSALLKTVQGLMAVLNENRQILAVNEGLLKDFNIPDPHKILGLRLGEAVSCVHAADHSGGCGTGKYCATCGAAIAIVAALASDVPEERKCILKVAQDEYGSDICLSVKAVTMNIEEQKFVLLFLQDMTEEEKRAALERVFFHDLNNIVMALAGLAEVASFGAAPPLEAVTRRMTALCKRLVREVQIQKALVQGEGYQLQREVISVADVVERLRCLAADLPHAQDKKVIFEEAPEPVQFVTDLPLLERVLTNMIINALEETSAEGAVVVSVAREVNSVHFNVWNDAYIPDKIAMRIFQRYFTTKEGRGRGFGTYSMKYFGEHYLGGTVSFTTSHAEGTVFTLVLPLPHSQE